MKNRFVLLISLLALTSCGTKVNDLGHARLDHSTIWNDNYYDYFDASLKELPTTLIELNSDNKVFTSYEDASFQELEERSHGDNALSYARDFDNEKGYGPNMKLSKSHQSVKEGFISKLYDGQLFCHGYYEAARVQIKEEGFSASLKGTLMQADYLYLNFKSALNFKEGNHPEGHDIDVRVNITFYTNEKGTTYSYLLNDVATNKGETYIFYGFKTSDLDLSNVTSYSISYKVEKDEYNESLEIKLAHALLLYEFGFKNPIFR